MKIVASIEARMGSSRLPGKSLKKILGKPMLELMIERVKECKEIDDIVVATSSNKKDDTIEDLALKLNINCFRGSEDDVLDRVLNAVKSVNGDIILELWGDCPLIDPRILDLLIQFYKKNNVDCAGTVLPNFKKEFPLGISALIFSTKILDEVNKITKNPEDRENVSNYIYEHPNKYNILPLPCPSEMNFPDLRLVVDEENDFQLIKIIFEKLYPKNPHFLTHDVIEFLNQNPQLKKLNKDVTQRRLSSWNKFEN